MKKTNEGNTQMNQEMAEAREFAQLCSRLTKSERQQVKAIIIGIQLAKESGQKAEKAG